ncbi:MAG: HEAT repeat domain-containing protein [Calditrichaceae bacterium]|nr:HEAT repeat domain-containing protein [Calditrichia bacterium]NUQ42146.1 HEAT repeat domain-containing protein [Calditrichaceae bacterium]
MHDLPYQQDPDWKSILERLSHIRLENDYSTGNVEFVRESLQSFDDRVRGGAALAAAGCLFEPNILDQVIGLAEYDENPAIRKAAVQALGEVISEGVEQGLEDEHGPGTALDDAEAWEEYQSGALQDDYLRVKHLLFNLLEFEEDLGMQELALTALADLGFLNEVQQKIGEFFASARASSRLVAVHAMGKYPQFWKDELEALVTPDTPAALLKEAISASYSSESARLAKAIEKVLSHSDPEVLRFAILTLANINKTENLPDILQHFTLHENSLVQEAARDGIEMYTRANFDKYLKDDLGMEE